MARDKRAMPITVPKIEPQAAPEPAPRLGSLHNALRLVAEHGGGPASDFDVDEAVGEWAGASEAELLAAARAGLEVVTSHRALGSDVNPAVLELFAAEIRDGLEDIERLLRG